MGQVTHTPLGGGVDKGGGGMDKGEEGHEVPPFVCVRRASMRHAGTSSWLKEPPNQVN